MRIAILIELDTPAGLTDGEVQARWSNNKVTAQISHAIESSAVGTIRSIEARQSRRLTIRGDCFDKMFEEEE